MKYEKLTFKMAYQLASPHTWAASIMPSIFAIAYVFNDGFNHHADMYLPIWKMLALIAACVLMQSSVNTLNDYFDYKKGTDSKEDNLDPTDAVLLYNNINPKHALTLGISYLVIAAALGISAAWACGIAPIAIGIVGGLCVLLYSGGALPISYLPLGELVSGFVMGGLIPLGIVAIAARRIVWIVLLYALPLIIGIGLIMMSNNGCDIEKDIEAGRKTLPSVLGRMKTRKLYGALSILWITLITVFSYMLSGLLVEVFTFLILIIFVRPIFIALVNSPLDQEHRIRQMGLILKANKIANGIYILSIAMCFIKYFI